MDNENLSVEVKPGQEKLGYASEALPVDARAAADAAFIRVMEFEANSNLIKNSHSNRDVSRLDWDDIKVEGLLGVGGFACVCKVRIPKFEEVDDIDCDPLTHVECKSSSDSSTNNSGDCCGPQTAATSISSSRASSTDHMSFALKCLNLRTVSNHDKFCSGAADLASEALLLSNLDHDNIVRLYAVSNGCVSQAFQSHGGYFLVLELLRGSCDDLLRLWREDLKERTLAAKIPEAKERLTGIAIHAAKGMEYLHQSNVILRDLKPHNIGFDSQGNVKLFDLGLAREITNDIKNNNNGTIPGIAGSYRYMAPEVALNEGCCYASDVYSFGTVLWELLSLQKPYEHMSSTIEFRKKVAVQGMRPSTKPIQSNNLKSLLKHCWHQKTTLRPTMTEVVNVLETEITNYDDDDKKAITLRQHYRLLKRYAKKTIQEQRERFNNLDRRKSA